MTGSVIESFLPIYLNTIFHTASLSRQISWSFLFVSSSITIFLKSSFPEGCASWWFVRSAFWQLRYLLSEFSFSKFIGIYASMLINEGYTDSICGTTGLKLETFQVNAGKR